MHISKKSSTFAPAFETELLKILFWERGKMAEWSIASVLKTEVLKGTGGSNPSLSAKRQVREIEQDAKENGSFCFHFLWTIVAVENLFS